jgi:hypothetical protein
MASSCATATTVKIHAQLNESRQSYKGRTECVAGRAMAHADPDMPGSEELKQALLKPLAAWESQAASGSEDKAGGDEDEAASDAAGGASAPELP